MRRIRVVTFNVLHGQRGDGSGLVDLDGLVNCVVGLRPDLLAMQEVDVGVPRSGRADQARMVAEATGMDRVFGKAARVGGIGKYGNALLARGALRDVHLLRLPRAARFHEPRAAIVATVHIDGLVLAVAATHLSTSRPEVHTQLEAVVAALDAHRASTGVPVPALLLGDLNLGPQEVDPVVARAGMTLAGGGPSFPAHRPTMRIDHVAARRLDLGAVEVVRTPCSDHRAVAVEVFQQV